MRKMFITGTDTEVGKTTFALWYLEYLKNRGFSTAALKPIAAGCDDPTKLQHACTINMAAEQINPVNLPKPIAPHLQQCISARKLKEVCQTALNLSADYLIIEGAGGWLCPINETESLADFATLIDAEVMMVVGIKLGCLNHAQLTERAIINSGVKYAGWVANCIDPNMDAQAENIQALEKLLTGKMLFCLSYQ